MQITRQADYGIRAVLYLCRLGNRERVPNKTIANQQHIPPSFLSKTISQLSVAGLLQTFRGSQGGIALAREPKDISLLDVIEAIDGPIKLNECVSADASCPFRGECPIRPIWCEAQSKLVKRLKCTTFEQMGSTSNFLFSSDIHPKEYATDKAPKGDIVLIRA